MYILCIISFLFRFLIEIENSNLITTNVTTNGDLRQHRAQILSTTHPTPRSPLENHIQQLCPPLYYNCDKLPGHCLNCNFNESCHYGSVINVTCHLLDGVYCKLPQNQLNGNPTNVVRPLNSTPILVEDDLGHTDYIVQRSIICRYCHQLDDDELICLGRIHCRYPNVARSFYETQCEPFGHCLCLGKRVFRRMVACDWSTGKSYFVAVILSLFFGGLGVDRFYLGMWVEGLGKLFSFGGLGVWSVVDFMLILLGYIKPMDDAVYW